MCQIVLKSAQTALKYAKTDEKEAKISLNMPKLA